MDKTKNRYKNLQNNCSREWNALIFGGKKILLNL